MSSLASDAATGDDGAFSLRSKRSGKRCRLRVRRQASMASRSKLPSRFVSLWKAMQRFAERIKATAHSARSRDRRGVTSGREFETASGVLTPGKPRHSGGSTLDNGGRVPTPRNLQGPGRDNSIYYWLRD